MCKFVEVLFQTLYKINNQLMSKVGNQYH